MRKNHNLALGTERDNLNLKREQHHVEKITLKRGGAIGEGMLIALGDLTGRVPGKIHPDLTLLPPFHLLGLPINQRYMKAGGQGGT